MNRTMSFIAGGLVAGFTLAVLAASSAQAQNLPPPGNVNPGSVYSGAEQTGAPDQPRSWRGYASRYSYGESYAPMMPGYVTPYGYHVPEVGGAPVYGGGYYE